MLICECGQNSLCTTNAIFDLAPFNLFPVLSLQEKTCLQASSEAFEMDNQKKGTSEETHKRKVERHFWELK